MSANALLGGRLLFRVMGSEGGKSVLTSVSVGLLTEHIAPTERYVAVALTAMGLGGVQ